MCCDFWGLDRSNYSLYDAKFGHLMALNSDEHHTAHTVSDYFEHLKMRHPSLFLLKDELEKPEIRATVQRESAAIKAPRGRGANPQSALIMSQDNRASKEAELQRRNVEHFNKAFPGQEKYHLDTRKSEKRVSTSFLPDTYFLTFLANALLIISVMVFFFQTRDIKEEFFIRTTVNNFFERAYTREVLGPSSTETTKLQPFSTVSSTDAFRAFITETLPVTIFTPDDKGLLAFAVQNPPLGGNLIIRTQHWLKPECPHTPVIADGVINECSQEPTEGTLEYMTTPLKSIDGAADLVWRSAADRGVETVLYDDDFSNAIDGSGYEVTVPYGWTPVEAKAYFERLFDESEFFRQSTIRVAAISFSFYVPSHDLLVSTLMEIRFDKAGSVRNRSFEVLPFQIFIAGDSEHPDVLRRARTVLAFSIIRVASCAYTLGMIFLKLRYRKVLGAVAGSVVRDLTQITLSLVPVIMGYRLQN